MKVLITDKYPDKLKDTLDKLVDEVTYLPGIKEEDLKKEILDADIVIIRSRTKINKDVIDSAKNLKYVITGTHGTDHVDYEYLEALGIKFDNIAEQDVSVAEYVFGLLLNLARDITWTSNWLKKGKNMKNRVMGVELYEKTLGIVGYGKIGKKVAEIANGFGMKVLSYDISKKTKDKNSKRVSLDALLKESDYITIHIPKTKDTYNLIGKKEIKKMKVGVYLINAARGEVVDENALFEDILSEDGKIRKLALDVSKLPLDLTNSWLSLSQKKVILTPHIGGQTAESRERTVNKIIKYVAKFVKEVENGS